VEVWGLGWVTAADWGWEEAAGSGWAEVEAEEGLG
jgi:hypothetical protein